MNPSHETRHKPLYYERVWPSIGSLLVSAVLFPLVTLVFLPLVDTVWAVLIGAGAFLAAALTMLSASPVIEIQVEEGKSLLKVANAKIDLSHLGNVAMVPIEQARAERGPKLHAKAFVYFQSGVTELLKVELLDPTDPTPYWLFSTRRPGALAAALEANKET